MMRRKYFTSINALFVISIFLIQFFVAPGQAQVSSTFDTGLEGWMVTGDNDSAWEAAGNPGGCLSVNDKATGELNFVIGPTIFHGDWSLMTSSDILSAEIYFDNTSGGPMLEIPYIFRIEDPGGAARSIEKSPPAHKSWKRYEVTMNPSNWIVEWGSWAEIISSTYSLQIDGEFVSGDEIVRIDNVELSSTPISVFIPDVSEDFNGPGPYDWSLLIST